MYNLILLRRYGNSLKNRKVNDYFAINREQAYNATSDQRPATNGGYLFEAVFSCRFSPLFLRLLFSYTKNNQALTKEILVSAIRREQADFTLHRNQVLRWREDIVNAFHTLDIKVRILPENKGRTTGPWFLADIDNIVLLDHSAQVIRQKSRYFRWEDDWQSIPNILYRFIENVLQADVLVSEGYLKLATEELLKCYEFPLRPPLEALVDLRRAKFLLQAGDFVNGKALATQISKQAERMGDTATSSLVAYLLAYTDYSEAPALNYSALLANMQKPPSFSHSDEVSLMNWHNLRALLLRRQAQDHPEIALNCHLQALYHFEESIFLAIRMNNTERTLDIIANIALHLQEFISLKLTKIEDVFNWYCLLVNHANKMECGGHSVWDRIFFAKFYLQYKDDIRTLANTQLEYLEQTSYMNPSNITFYTDTLEKLEQTDDPRQKIIFLLLSIDFSERNKKSDYAKRLKEQARHLLSKQSDGFVRALRAEGYDEAIDRFLL